MSEYTIDGTSHDINEVIRYLDGDHHMGVHDRARVVAELRAQLPKPVPLEPTGDSLVWVWGEVYARQVDIGEFWSMTSSGPRYTWADMWAECRRTNSAAPVVYDRRIATPPTEEWWITTTFFPDGAKVAGPFGSKDEALTVRLALEKYLLTDRIHSETTFCVDSPPPTEEVAEPGWVSTGTKHKQSCEWPECPGNEDCEGLSLLSEVTMGLTAEAEN